MLKIITLLLFFFTLSACRPIERILAYEIVDVTLDETSLKEVYYLDHFDISSIKLLVEKEDGTIEHQPLSFNMFNREDREKLESDGVHKVTARYRGYEVEFEIRLSTQTTF